MRKVHQYLINVLVVLSQALNTIIFLGDPDETLSGRIGRAYPNSVFRKIVDWIFGKGHCRKTYSRGDKGQEL